MSTPSLATVYSGMLFVIPKVEAAVADVPIVVLDRLMRMRSQAGRLPRQGSQNDPAEVRYAPDIEKRSALQKAERATRLRIFNSPVDLQAEVGRHLGYSEWHVITQAQINTFARSTGDFQWIHTDPVRAAAGPYGTTIAHGFLTLALVPVLVQQVYVVEGLGARLNYGANRLRFPSPVPVNSRIRAGVELVSCLVAGAGFKVVCHVVIELEGSEKPACVVETVTLLVP